MMNRKLFFAVSLLVAGRAFASEGVVLPSSSRCSKVADTTKVLVKKNLLTAAVASGTAYILSNDTTTRVAIIGASLVAHNLCSQIKSYPKCPTLQASRATEITAICALSGAVTRLLTGKPGVDAILATTQRCVSACIKQ